MTSQYLTSDHPQRDTLNPEHLSRVQGYLASVVNKIGRKIQSGNINVVQQTQTPPKKQHEIDQYDQTQHQKTVPPSPMILLRRLTLQKQQRQQQMQQKALSREQQVARIEEEKQKQLQQTIRHQAQKKQNEIQARLNQMKDKHEKFLQQQSVRDNQVRKVLEEQEPLYVKMEKRYQSEVMLPQIKRREKALEGIHREKSKYSLNQIKQHQQQYLLRVQRRNSSEGLSGKATNSQIDIVPNQDSNVDLTLGENQFSPRQTTTKNDQHNLLKKINSYAPPKHSKRMEKLIQQENKQYEVEREQRRKKLEQRKNRVLTYEEYVKKNFSPKQRNLQAPEDLQGVVGMISNPARSSRPQVEAKVLGLGYLEHVRRLKKKKPSENELEEEQKTQQPSTSRVSSLSKRYHHSVRHQKSKEPIREIMEDDSLDISAKLQKLDEYNKKLNYSVEVKQAQLNIGFSPKKSDKAARLLLESISAKLGIIRLRQEANGQKHAQSISSTDSDDD